MKTRILALFLAFCVAFTAMPITAYATEIQSTEIEEAVVLETETDEGTEPEETVEGITRIQWLQRLTEAYGMSVEESNYPDNYYSDIDSNYTYYYDVMLATEFGLVDVEAGDAFEPDAPATREFVAHTLNACMGYVLEEENYTFAEYEVVTYPDDIQIAINKGWFEVSESGEFLPNEMVYEEQQTTLINLAIADINDTVINEENENSYELQSNVIVIPETVTIQMIDVETYTLTGDIDTLALEDGNMVAFISNEFPIVKKILEINTVDNVITLVTESVKTEEAFISIDYEGNMDGNLLDVQTFSEDIQLMYVVGGTAEKEYSDGNIYDSPDGLAEEEISAVKLVQQFEISDEVAAEFELGENATAEITCTISNPSVDYKITTFTPYINFNSTVTFSCNVSMDVLGAINAPDDITLAKIPVGYIGFVEATLELSAEGEATATLVENVSMGVKYNNGFQLTKQFKKEAFTLQANVDASIGVRLSAGFDAVVLEGEVYGEVGAKANANVISYGDGLSPKNCVHLTAYMYALVGCEIELDLGSDEKEYTNEHEFFDEDSSPVKIAFHYEEGKAVPKCTNTRGESGETGTTTPKEYKYYTPVDSKYGYSGVNSGQGSTGTNYSVFEYQIIDDTTDKEKICITGYNGNYASLNIPSQIDGYTVTEIGGFVFRNHNELRMVVIPDTVTTIGYQSFRYCLNLSTVVMSKNIENIEEFAFEGCKNLKSITLPKTLKTIIRYAFNDCDSLTKIVLPESLTAIGFEAFGNCDGLREVSIPAELEDINADGPFNGCPNLKKVIYEEGTQYIYNGWTRGCISLTDVYMPDSVVEIKPRAFCELINLTRIRLSKNITTIGPEAFDSCIKLQNFELPNTVRSIGDEAFYNCDSLTEITIPPYLVDENCGNNVFGECHNLKTVHIAEKTTSICNNFFENCIGLKEITLPNTVKRIGIHAFKNCPNLATVTLSNNITEIEDYAFESCTSLKTISLPNSLTTLGNGVFHSCSALEEIVLPNTITKIGKSVFENCFSLDFVAWSTSLSEIQEAMFRNCSSLKKITGIQNITNIQNYAFYNTNIVDISGFTNLKTIGYAAFYNNDSLKDAIFTDSLVAIGDYAFYDSDALQRVSIPDSVTELGSHCFMNCNELVNVSLGLGLTRIKNNTFMECVKLPSIVVPYNVTTIDSEAFKNNIALISVHLPRKTNNIADNAFSYPGQITIYGISGTYAETFADKQKMQFVDNTIHATSIVLPFKTNSMNLGSTIQLTPTVTPVDFNDEIKYRSLDENVLTVSETGLIRAVGLGEATIKVTIGSVSASCRITVLQPVNSISLNATSIELDDEKTYQLKATVYPNNASNKDLTWESSNSSIATVSQDGLVTAKQKGSCVITARATDGSDVYRTCNITVLNNIYIVSNADELESAHPYTINANDTWIYTVNDVRSITVTFDPKTSVEEYCDYIYIYDQNNSLIGKYTGTELSGKSIRVDGTTIKLKLLSDESGCEYGFKVSSIKTEKIPKYNIAFNGNGSTSGSMSPMKDCISGNSYILTKNAFSRKGYTFNGWNTKADGSGDAYDDQVSVIDLTTKNGETVTLYAQWKKIKYTITYNLNGGKNNSANKSAYYVNTATFSLKEPVKTGYTFKGWYSDSKFTKPVTEVKKGSTGNKTFYAKWSATKYTITYNLNGGKNNSSNKNSYYITTTTFTLKNPTKTGYTFKGWYSDSKFTKPVTEVKKGSAGNKTFYAKWVKTKYKITYNLNNGKNNSNNPSSYYVTTATITLNKPTRTGYTFKGWYSDSKFRNQVTRIKKGSTGNIKLYAKWEVTKYKITYTLNGGKNNSKNPATYTVNKSTITLQKPTRSGYTFKGWYSDSNFKTKVTQIKKGSTGNMKLYAKWSKNK